MLSASRGELNQLTVELAPPVAGGRTRLIGRSPDRTFDRAAVAWPDGGEAGADRVAMAGSDPSR